MTMIIFSDITDDDDDDDSSSSSEYNGILEISVDSGACNMQ